MDVTRHDVMHFTVAASDTRHGMNKEYAVTTIRDSIFDLTTAFRNLQGAEMEICCVLEEGPWRCFAM
jgi:hypothetical protein